MKREKIIATILTTALTVGIFSGCGKKTTPTTTGDEILTPPIQTTLETSEPSEEPTAEPTTETTTPILEGVYCIDGMTPEELVELAKTYANIKDNDTFIDIYNKFEVKPFNVDPTRLEKYDAYGMNFAWNNTAFDHNRLDKCYFENNSYQYEEHEKVRLYANSYVRFDFYFVNEEDCIAAGKAFYDYLVSLGEIDPEKTDDINVIPEKIAGAYAWTIAFKEYPVQDTRNFTTDSCKGTYGDYRYAESFIIIEQNYGSIGNYLSVDIPVADDVYQGGL